MNVHAPLSVVMDPHHPVATADLQAEYDALQGLAATQERVEVAIARLDSVHRQIGALHTVPVAMRVAIEAYDQRLTAQLDLLRNPEPSGYRRPAELSEQLAYLRDTIEQYDGPPTDSQRAFLQQYAAQAEEAGAATARLTGSDLQNINTELKASGLPELHT